MSYEGENKELLKSVLEGTFFDDFKNPDREGNLFGTLEIQLTSQCNLKCSYCYYSNVVGHGKELNKPGVATWDQLGKNTDILFNWLKENNYIPKTIDIFSGDSLIFKQSHDIIRKAVQFYIDIGYKGSVVVPSNMSFIRDPELVKSIEDIIALGAEHGVSVPISASIDGKFADKITRLPVKNVDIDEYYSDEFYDDVFAFCKRNHAGFHPMISSENIHVWKDNFVWFQSMFEKYDLAWNNVYLLEVRNEGWTKETIKQYGEFMSWTLNFTYNMIGNSVLPSNLPKYYVDNFVFSSEDYRGSSMNLFNNISIIGRGIGCSLQTTLFVKMSDLTCNSCHRLSYDALNGFKFVVKDDKIIDIEPLNITFYMATLTFEHKALPYCENCLIKHLCSGGCPGAQFESVGDAFTPIPSVCLLQHMKLKTQVEFFKRLGVFNYVVSKLNSELALTMIEVERMSNE